MNRLVVVLALSVAASVAVGADGESTKTPVGDDTFKALDRNADYRLSRSEAGFDDTLSRTFADLDDDGNGFLTPLEYAAAEMRPTDDQQVSN